ncbi:MAG: phosphoglucosamine mutase [Bacteroidetes bacterium]|nr:phosphoglucosamine mutase [Bacteroidota bacterium]MBV6460042.1 Phosphomannomutase/phosphoglucomutase [Flavobacteriales bacterium]WKZ76660.1 MAG: phosphoglucosamine mutase [Vicingaceae bacterium]MCL4816392.1 phosphoglucosamine mutase [Flavobacteriales bacterium]NOG95467.1 phosphoglucosamine mutase [Bacteroidota bacterium]
MTLIKSISGIRGTIGGKAGEAFTPIDIAKFTAAFGYWLLQKNNQQKTKVVVGRDARISGSIVNQLVISTLQLLGIDVVDLGLSTTPTVEVAVTEEKANGGIIITASHNPKQWNALKLLNQQGEFISASDGAEVLRMAEKEEFEFAEINFLGNYTENNSYLEKHIQKILALPLVNPKAIAKKDFTIVVDAVNSTGGIYVPALLRALGVKNIIELNCNPNGNFAHNPEPLPENLIEISKAVAKQNAHLGIVVDPDVDRLAIVCEDGEMFGEEYTLVAVADYVLQHTPGNTVSNLSSTKALRDITEKAGQRYNVSAVGEVNVVEKMKETNAVIGGEGNGGVIYPELHYGRDAMVGIALFLSHLATFSDGHCTKCCSSLRAKYPNYYISKNKIELTDGMNVTNILHKIKEKYSKQPVNTIDGVKIEFDNEWIHLRTSNTEPIIRIYAESTSMATANNLADKIITDIKEIIRLNSNT